MAPEIHQAVTLADRELAWAAVDSITAAGWGTLGYRLHRRLGAREERQPFLDIKWPDSIEDLIRTRLRRPRKPPSYAMQWRAAVESRKPPLSETALLRLYASPIEVAGRPVEEVLSHFLSIRDIAHEPLLLREVSCVCFGGSPSFWMDGPM